MQIITGKDYVCKNANIEKIKIVDINKDVTNSMQVHGVAYYKTGEAIRISYDINGVQLYDPDMSIIGEYVDKKTAWGLNIGDECYIVNHLNQIETKYYIITKEMKLLRHDGRLFTTQQDAQKYIDYKNSLYRVENFIRILNKGWVPDWTNDEKKFSFYLKIENLINITESVNCKYLSNSLYLRVKNDALKVLQYNKDDLVNILKY